MTMGDLVYIRGLALEAVIGVHDWERGIRQALVLDLELASNNRSAAASDELIDAIDYQAVANAVQALASASNYRLVESLAEAIATHVLVEFPVQRLRLRLAKPGALPAGTEVGVEIERSAD